MREAFKNFTMVLIVVLLLLGIGWIVATNRAFSKPPPHPYPHPVLDALAKGHLKISYRGNEQKPNRIEAFRSADPNAILWVDARPSGEGTWWAYTERSFPDNPRMWLAFMHDKDIAPKEIDKLTDVLKAFPDRMFVINLQDYKEGDKERIIKVIEDAKAGQRALISSPEDGILRDLREAEPTWVFGTSRAQVTRLIMLSQLFMAASAPMAGDVFVWDPLIPASKINAAVWAEVQRREMRSILPAASPFADKADAVIF